MVSTPPNVPFLDRIMGFICSEQPFEAKLYSFQSSPAIGYEIGGLKIGFFANISKVFDLWNSFMFSTPPNVIIVDILMWLFCSLRPFKAILCPFLYPSSDAFGAPEA